MPAPYETFQHPLLFIGHPGHELRLWGWVASARPDVCILTDGSGSTGHPRLDATRAALDAVGARPQSPFGALTDSTVYDALLSGEYAPLRLVARDLLHVVLDSGADALISDAIEGYNPTHDVCGLIGQAVVEAAARRGRPCRGFAFDVVQAASAGPAAIQVTLDEQGLDDKIALAREYARQAGDMLAREVDDMLARHGREAFQREHLVPTSPRPLAERFSNEPPFYERHGERRVREGKYAHAVRLHAHLVPFAEDLERWAREDAA